MVFHNLWQFSIFFFFNSAHHPQRTMRQLDKGSLYSCSEAGPCWTQAASSQRSVYKPAAPCRAQGCVLPSRGSQTGPTAASPFPASLPPRDKGCLKGSGRSQDPRGGLTRGPARHRCPSPPSAPTPKPETRLPSATPKPEVIARPRCSHDRGSAPQPALSSLTAGRRTKSAVIRPQNRGACGRKRGAAARCHGDPGRPRVRGCPAQARVPALVATRRPRCPPSPALLFRPRPSAQDAGPSVRCRPVPLTHGGGAVSGAESLGPASSSLQARSGCHGICDQARCGPQRSARRGTPGRSRGAATGAGARSLLPAGEKPALQSFPESSRTGRRKRSLKEASGVRSRRAGPWLDHPPLTLRASPTP